MNNVFKVISQLMSLLFFWNTRNSKVPKRPFKRRYRK